ncbi:MAG TPA: hypothetical protein VI076_05490 [Actinopolymorphaceae bacterium]
MNELRRRYPDLYARHAAKYEGREHVLSQPVPPLECTWGDVTFFSPVDSRVLFEAIRESGRKVPVMRNWTLDAGHLDPSRTCIRLMRKSATAISSEPATPDDFLPFTTATLRAVSRVTDAALTRLRNLTADEPLLPWVDVPHVLHRGPVPFSLFTECDGQDVAPDQTVTR